MNNYIVHTESGVLGFSSLADAIEAAQKFEGKIYKFDNDMWNNIPCSSSKDPRLERFTLAAMQGFCVDGGNVEHIAIGAVQVAQATIKALDEAK
jgi:hypothetical protein